MENVPPAQTSSRVQRFSFSSFGGTEKKPETHVQKPVQAVAPAVEQEKHFYEPVPAPENVITEEELQKARKEGHEQGYKEGFAACEARVEKENIKREEDTKSVLEVIANRLTIAAEEHTAYIAGQLEITKSLALAIARKVAGDALKHEPYENVESVLRECLALIVGEPKIIVTVSPVLASGLKQRIDGLRPLLPGFEGELIVEENSALNENDCRVEWKSGHAARDSAKLWNDIETIISRTPMNKRL